jgi:hypothetical protein
MKVSLTHRPPLPRRIYSWYSFLIEVGALFDPRAIVRPGGLSQLEIPRPSILYRSAPTNCATGYPAFGWTVVSSLLFEAYESNGGSWRGCPVARIRDKWRNVHRALGVWRVRSSIPFINESFQFSPKAVTTLLSAWVIRSGYELFIWHRRLCSITCSYITSRYRMSCARLVKGEDSHFRH